MTRFTRSVGGACKNAAVTWSRRPTLPGKRERLVTRPPVRESSPSHESRSTGNAPPTHDCGGGDRRGARLGFGAAANAPGHFPDIVHSHHLRRATIRRHGPGADGRLSHLLLRVSLPLHHRHRACRVEV